MIALEEDLKRIVCLFPDLIEEGLKIEKEEFPIKGIESTYRCDLKGIDKSGTTVLVELKLRAGERVVYQILKYKTLVGQKARFLVAAFECHSDVRLVLGEYGCEYKQIDKATAEALLEKERGNPKLYDRQWMAAQSDKQVFPACDLRTGLGGYAAEEREVVLAHFTRVAALLQQCLTEQNDIVMIGDKPKDSGKDNEKVRLRFKVPTSVPSDCFVIYARSREAVKEGIEFHFVPNFALKGGVKNIGVDADKRKKDFKKFMAMRQGELENAFGLPMHHRRHGNANSLSITAHGWKGFSMRLHKPVSEWHNPDFADMVAQQFVRFAETMLPYIKEFDRAQSS